MQAKLAGSASPATTGRPSLYTDLTAPSGAMQGGSILGGLDSARQPFKIRGVILATSLMLALGVAGWCVMQSRPAAIVPDKPVAGLVASLPAAIPATPLVTPQAEAPAVIVADAGVSAMPVKTADAQPSDAAPVQAQSQVAHEQSLGPKEELLPPVATALQAPPVLNAPAPAAISPTIPTIAAPGRPANKPALAKKAPAIAAANGATTAKSIQKDGDVELIAALLNRVATRPDAPASDTVRKARPDEMQKSAAAGTPKKNRKTAGYRELASPKAVDATMAQLERCNTLGFFEAEMCRLRACTGRWGSDPGCPEYAQISSVAP